MSRSKRVELFVSSAKLWFAMIPENASVEMVKELLLDAKAVSLFVLVTRQFQMYVP